MSASISEDEDFVICGSEDGSVYIWNRINQYVPTINPMYFSFITANSFTGFKKDHNESVEYFNVFGKVPVTNAQFVPLTVLQNVSKCFATYVPPAIVKQILVVTSYDGQIKVFYQILDLK